MQVEVIEAPRELSKDESLHSHRELDVDRSRCLARGDSDGTQKAARELTLIQAASGHPNCSSRIKANRTARLD